MNALQIEYFLTLAKHLSFTNAANSLYVTQPAISKQIKALEQELKIKLFNRSSRSVTLTPAGVIMLQFFTQASADFHKALAEAEKASENLKESLIIGITEELAYPGMSEFVGAFLQKYQSLDIKIESSSSSRLVSDLTSGSLDILILFKTDLEGQAKIETCGLLDTQCVAIMSANHPLTQKEDLKFTDLSDEVFYISTANNAIVAERFITEICGRYGFNPRKKHLANINSVLDYVESGLGVAIVDKLIVAHSQNTLKYLPLDEYHTIMAAWKNGSLNPLIHEFVKCLGKRVKNVTSSF